MCFYISPEGVWHDSVTLVKDSLDCEGHKSVEIAGCIGVDRDWSVRRGGVDGTGVDGRDVCDTGRHG